MRMRMNEPLALAAVQSEPGFRRTFETDLNHHGWFAADHPALVIRLDDKHHRGREIGRAAVLDIYPGQSQPNVPAVSSP